jgi:hypothetical protein
MDLVVTLLSNHVRGAVRTALEAPGPNGGPAFEFGLQRVLDGIGAYIDFRRSSP